MLPHNNRAMNVSQLKVRRVWRRSRGSAVSSRNGRLRACVLVVAALIAVVASASATRAFADDISNRRVRAGARLFRSLLAAQTTLDTLVAADGKLHVVVFGHDESLEPEVADLIAAGSEAGKGSIHGLPVTIDAVDDVTALSLKPQPAGVFLLSFQSDSNFNALARWSRTARIVLYSPFEGDVERGAMAGLSVEATVRPYLNLSQLRAAGIRIKPFYMKVAKVLP